ncbi:MAG TPA: hypothetical protein VL171_02990 [Verrucomicrobiae bacterium]|nr:hypothetical protein [Verrucomicrobiae bacterium]
MNKPVCQHLRTKKLFIPEESAEALAEPTEPEAEPFYWCARTLTPIGVDDQPVHVRLCVEGRCCFEK